MMRAKIATCALLLACSVQLNAASLPGQGASMSQVEQDFGSPLSKTGPVGTPPITRWTYDGFVVVFERSKVVHSMSVTGQQPARRPATPVRAPAPAPVKSTAPVAPAPAAAVQKPATPAATPVTPTQADSAEQARRQAERDAAKARADADAAKARAAEEAAAAEALRKPVEAAPEAATPQAAPVPVPAPAAATPAPEAAPAPKRTTEDALKAAPGFSFDPATGRVILK